MNNLPDEFGPEGHPVGWNRRDWVIRELQAPPKEDPEDEGNTDPFSGYN